MLPDEEFLAWFFTYFLDAASCPHCNADIYEDEIKELGDEYIVCPHCNKQIKKDDLT